MASGILPAKRHGLLLVDLSLDLRPASAWPRLGTGSSRPDIWEGHTHLLADLTDDVKRVASGNAGRARLGICLGSAITTGRLRRTNALAADGTSCGTLEPLLLQGLAGGYNVCGA
jgi:hypothetical protein